MFCLRMSSIVWCLWAFSCLSYYEFCLNRIFWKVGLLVSPQERTNGANWYDNGIKYEVLSSELLEKMDGRSGEHKIDTDILIKTNSWGKLHPRLLSSPTKKQKPYGVAKRV